MKDGFDEVDPADIANNFYLSHLKKQNPESICTWNVQASLVAGAGKNEKRDHGCVFF